MRCLLLLFTFGLGFHLYSQNKKIGKPHLSCTIILAFSYWWTIFLVLHSFNWSLESPLKPLQWHSVNISEWCQAKISVIAHKLRIELKLYYCLLRCLMHEFSYLVWVSWWHTIFFFFLKLHEFLWIWFKMYSLKMITWQTFPSIVSSAHGLKRNDYARMVYFWKSRNSLQRRI